MLDVIPVFTVQYIVIMEQAPILDNAPYVSIMRSAHVVKGASSNLMCAQLRETAMQLETAASEASNDPNSLTDPAVLLSVQKRHNDLKDAVEKYHAYLKSIDV
jgi:HPt (histidine-containing phosphotransfer) domain-containing protein